MENRCHLFVLSLLGLAGCAQSVPPAPAMPPQASPEAAPLAISETRPIEDLHRRTIGFLDAGIWISNEFEGGRVSDAWQEAKDRFVLLNRPENYPINPSAWYAFKIWSDTTRTIQVRLTYENGRHRYWPEFRREGESWSTMDSSKVVVDTVAREATLTLDVGPDTLWVAGQEMMTSSFFDTWTEMLARKSYVTRRVAGTSGRGRPMFLVEVGNPAATRHVVVIGRQHPPEATGTMGLLGFVEEMVGESELAEEFRESFRVHVIPLVNPDGVDLGHWRHNTGGVDLNRDWEAFNQPETRVVRDVFSEILGRHGHALWFAVDFHSTQRDVFYTIDRSLETDPPGITDRWLDFISAQLPHYEVNDSPGDVDGGISKNWFYKTFGAPALIYEVGDQTDRDLIREVATAAAQGTMRVLLDEMKR